MVLNSITRETLTLDRYGLNFNVDTDVAALHKIEASTDGGVTYSPIATQLLDIGAGLVFRLPSVDLYKNSSKTISFRLKLNQISSNAVTI